MRDADPRPDDTALYCPWCDWEMEWANCWQCHGLGGWHDCGEDCCPCLDKDEVTYLCDECDGEGGHFWCPNHRCKFTHAGNVQTKEPTP